MKLFDMSLLTKRLELVGSFSTPRAILSLATVFIPITLINEQFLSSVYLQILIMYSSITILGFLIGGQDLLNYLQKVNYSWKKTFKIAIIIYVANMILTYLGILLVGSDPQGIAGKEDSIYVFFKNLSLLPFIGFGEEIFRLLTFLGFFSLLLGNIYVRFITASVLTSCLFGLMHTFDYPLATFLPLALGAIPVIVLTIYYKSVLPAIIQHLLLDGLSFLAHLEQIGEWLAGTIILFAVFIWIFRKYFIKSKDTT
ncbi:CPBP family glutamic-type intramembrane protease [Halalkalibacter urbisdiaboli]|uniref:CPBP family glutamic-type intramembrane protease n=1 Tax=Halalkalibacter urbisdiaboli TaxID=1960589 RepID=UPI000B443966|nr:CPBP family glutamic-type intramembrane protease [Halalkalibacter urbisdiaboli]